MSGNLERVDFAAHQDKLKTVRIERGARDERVKEVVSEEVKEVVSREVKSESLPPSRESTRHNALSLGPLECSQGHLGFGTGGIRPT